MSRAPEAAVHRPGGRKLKQLAATPVDTLHGVGPRKASALRSIGVHTVLDLLMSYPRRYADRTNAVQVADATVGEEAVVSGVVTTVTSRRLRHGLAMVSVGIDDGSGLLTLTYFNQPWRAQQLRRGSELVVFGKIEAFRSRLSMTNPETDVVSGPGAGERARTTGLVVPIYRQSEKAGLSSIELRRYIDEVLERSKEFADPLPEDLRRRLGLIGRTEAFAAIHAPESLAATRPARRRLAFDELFRLQLELVERKRAAEAASRGIAHRVEGELLSAFLAGLPFELTAAQRAALGEITGDLAGQHAMHRLLQGDVGSGKTVVALATLLVAVQGGYQGALMVPTEVLAEQHFLAARRLLARLEVPDPGRLGGTRPLEVALLTSRTGAAERARLRAELAAGAVDVLVGTHALITDDVVFGALGVVVIDEQHRFGVDQRAALREKGAGVDPDLLVMTATPIPRTAAMTVYGDLDLSVLDELPAGRQPVVTRWIDTPEGEDVAWEAVREAVEAGQRAYVVCPLVRPSDDGAGDDDGAAADEGAGAGALDDAGDDDAAGSGDGVVSDATASTGSAGAGASFPEGRLLSVDLGGDAEGPAERPPPRNAVDEHARLGAGPLAGLRLGLLHGQLPAREKEQVMSSFRSGEIDVLVATTVIEVGVDVPEATVMVIEDADRFGIAQLHQLRGRVGRGALESRCYLLAAGVGEQGERRLRALEATNDGFELAEVDLDLRGEGTVLGARQKGRNDLRLASLRTDRDLVLAARREAEAIVADDPDLAAHPLLADELSIFIDEEEAGYLSKS
ncbi:MAG TPA: ATP-dependent DNA helicase RecG [Acidimicrobiales bacterium]|nr:ATP-dependent DNA helicase RecG [Acidimicrobiales bacterium]